MVTGNTPQWFLRKHADGEIFGPVLFDQIRDWSMSAQIHPQDVISNDGRTWNKAPMIGELQMDWLVEIPGQPLYGPTTAGTLLEFLSSGEISAETKILNCCSGAVMRLGDVNFFPSTPHNLESGAKENLQKHLLELEMTLLEKSTELNFALDTIARLEQRIKELESA
jgi:hypothetical protein